MIQRWDSEAELCPNDTEMGKSSRKAAVSAALLTSIRALRERESLRKPFSDEDGDRLAWQDKKLSFGEKSGFQVDTSQSLGGRAGRNPDTFLSKLIIIVHRTLNCMRVDPLAWLDFSKPCEKRAVLQELKVFYKGKEVDLTCRTKNSDSAQIQVCSSGGDTPKMT